MHDLDLKFVCLFCPDDAEMQREDACGRKLRDHDGVTDPQQALLRSTAAVSHRSAASKVGVGGAAIDSGRSMLTPWDYGVTVKDSVMAKSSPAVDPPALRTATWIRWEPRLAAVGIQV